MKGSIAENRKSVQILQIRIFSIFVIFSSSSIAQETLKARLIITCVPLKKDISEGIIKT